MNLKEPRRKTKYKQTNKCPLPTNLPQKLKINFNGFNLSITSPTYMKQLNSNGCFGKGNLSRNSPNYQGPILRQRQFNLHKNFKETKPEKVLIVPDSDSESTDNYFVNLNVRYELDCSGLKEVLSLGLEEGFFLMKDLNCLEIYDGEEMLDIKTAWEIFSKTDEYFIQNYIIYYYYRSMNWVVKTAVKFGGDFVLYKDSPERYHASYVVIIDILDSTLNRRKKLCRRSMSMKNLLGLNRLCETAGKELLICQIVLPESEILSYENLSNLTIKEVLMRRWIPTKNSNIQ